MGTAAEAGTLAVAGPLLAVGSRPVLCLAFAAIGGVTAAAYIGGRR